MMIFSTGSTIFFILLLTKKKDMNVNAKHIHTIYYLIDIIMRILMVYYILLMPLIYAN